ncbi:styrene monooxygenase subunit StyA [Piscinibacter sakaiensis]|uniref:Styrene monooxygenase, subunit A n=1 Tax=Piscinibacter sakaiensis TaxID=1547922 RepID=A0A0K8P067_PISS1|nr:styrene monooxygenase/indole monooxygenase family protein [Piscinibacter sakaiensis]GAP36023.1 styrene monooxygenase, subunit A [Piscinibacter sakaiensis]
MDKRIAIVGGGVGGLHLGLYLLQHGIPVTIHTDRRPEELATGRLLNTVAHHAVTLAREAQLGVDHWPTEDFGYYCHYHHFGGEQPLFFRGDFAAPSRAVDYRVYLPRLMADFAERGGRLQYGELKADDVARLAQEADLVVVCTGKGPLGRMFAHDPAHSPYDRPQRLLCVGLYAGVAEEATRSVTLSVSPGHGELIDIPTLTAGGMAHALLMENVPGGDLEQLPRLRYEDGPRRFLDTLLAKLEQHHPTVARRIDPSAFDLANGPGDLLQGGVTPTVRRTHVPLGDGKFALALGDVHAVVDPLCGQGANLASYAAFVLGEEIVRQSVYDERFCEQVDARRCDRVLGAVRWTNLFLAPPAPELQQVIGTMSQDRAMCDEFTDNFNRPEAQWDRLASPQRMRAWLAEREAARA